MYGYLHWLCWRQRGPHSNPLPCQGSFLILPPQSQINHNRTTTTTTTFDHVFFLSSKNGGLNNDGDDFFFEENEKEALEGQAMAKEFYEQLRTRETKTTTTDETTTDNTNNNNNNKEEEEEYYERASSNASKFKFTGRQGEIDSTGTPSAGLFDRSNGSVFGYPVEGSSNPRGSTAVGSTNNGGRQAMVREQMMQSEYRLASLAGGERSILIQLALALVALCAVLYVGISGGITDGSERLGLDSDPMPDILDYATIQSSAPTVDVIRTSPTDGSIWL